MQNRVTCVRSFGNIAWPARSPDLTVPGIMTIQELKQAIVDEVAAIDEGLQRRVYGTLQTRLQQCIDVRGGYLPDVQKIDL